MKNTSIENVGKTLQSAYDEQYTDSMTEWRDLCAKYKAINIDDVCKGKTFASILDCGAGEGSVLKFMNDSSLTDSLYAIEISDSGLSQINKRNLKKLKEAKKFNGYEIPYADKFFELSYCSHVLEHVEHVRLLLRELKRVSEYQCFEIPLDYSVNVDQQVEYFLKWGHINMFTPALFKFLLKSEGFEIISEKLDHMPDEVLRYNMFKNFGQKPTLLNRIKLASIPLRRVIKRVLYGKKRYEEYHFSTYTCLAKGVGELKIF